MKWNKAFVAFMVAKFIQRVRNRPTMHKDKWGLTFKKFMKIFDYMFKIGCNKEY